MHACGYEFLLPSTHDQWNSHLTNTFFSVCFLAAAAAVCLSVVVRQRQSSRNPTSTLFGYGVYGLITRSLWLFEMDTVHKKQIHQE